MEVLTATLAAAVAIPVGSWLRRRYRFGDRESWVSLFIAELRYKKKLEEFELPDGTNIHSLA